MARISSDCAVAAVAFVIASLYVAPVAAVTAQRTFVASYGQSANIAAHCSIANPCRQFSEAISVTSAGGEVIVLDSAGYGAVTITQAVSIIAPPGVYAGISVFSGNNGITVIAGSSDTVILSGLSINNQGGASGVHINSAGAVLIDRCVINGMFNGVDFQPAAVTRLRISETIVRNSSSSGFVGGAQNAAGAASPVEITRSLFQDNSYGIYMGDISRAAITDTVVQGSGTSGITAYAGSLVTTNPSLAVDRTEITGNGEGILALSGGAFISVVNVSNSVIANNGTGVDSSTNGYVRVMGSQITGNGIGVNLTNNGIVASLGNNMRIGNGSNGPAAATITPY